MASRPAAPTTTALPASSVALRRATTRATASASARRSRRLVTWAGKATADRLPGVTQNRRARPAVVPGEAAVAAPSQQTRVIAVLAETAEAATVAEKAPGASPASSTRVYSLKRASSRRWGTGKPWESKPPPGDGPDRPAWMHKWMLRCPRPAPSRPAPKGRARAGRRPGHGRIARHDRRGGDQASHRLKPIPRRSGR